MRSLSGRDALSGLAVLLFVLAAAVAAVVLADATRTAHTPVESAIVGLQVAVLVAPTLALFVVSRRTDVERYRPVIEWGVLVGVSVAASTAIGNTHMESMVRHSWLSLAMSVLTAMNVGCLLGVLIGAHAEQAEENARIANARRDDFVFLNRLLRHHLLNAVTIIRGRAGFLEGEVPPEDEEHVTAIRERSDHIASLVETVQTIANALSDETETSPVDADALLRTVVDAHRDTADGVDITLDAAEGTYVASNGALRVVFDHLVENAIKHNDTDTPRIRITATRDDDTVTIRVADDGPGLPPDAKESAFEPGTAGDSAFGLYAVRVIVEDCGGDVVIEETDDWTVVEVTLPAATPKS